MYKIFFVSLIFCCKYNNSCTSQELYTIKACSKYGFACTDNCCDKQLFDRNTTLYIKLEDTEFYKVYSIEDLFAVFAQKPNATYILNGGNTAQGNFPECKCV